MNLIMRRNSVREFLDKPVPSDLVTKLLASGMQAPSANNQQPWEFIVVDDREIINELIKTSNGARPLKTATLCIIPMIKPGDKSPLFNVQDLSAATTNILLEATNLGLGGVWIGVYPDPVRYKHIEKVLNITGDIHPFCMLAIGYPKNVRPIVKRYDESKVHYNKWRD
jgi:nitroreductase